MHGGDTMIDVSVLAISSCGGYSGLFHVECGDGGLESRDERSVCVVSETWEGGMGCDGEIVADEENSTTPLLKRLFPFLSE